MIYVIGKKNQNLTLQLTEKALEISEVAAEMAVRLSASLLTDCIALSRGHFCFAIFSVRENHGILRTATQNLWRYFTIL